MRGQGTAAKNIEFAIFFITLFLEDHLPHLLLMSRPIAPVSLLCWGVRWSAPARYWYIQEFSLNLECPATRKLLPKKDKLIIFFFTYNILIFHFIAVAVPYYRQGATDTDMNNVFGQDVQQLKNGHPNQYPNKSF